MVTANCFDIAYAFSGAGLINPGDCTGSIPSLTKYYVPGQEIVQAVSLDTNIVQGAPVSYDLVLPLGSQLTNSGGPTGELDLQVITGAYHPVSAPNGQRANIFTESSGAGTPLLCLHTAGADTRQFHGVMTDLALRTSWRMIGFDMPSHGRTMPPTGWVGESYAPRQPIWTGA